MKKMMSRLISALLALVLLAAPASALTVEQALGLRRRQPGRADPDSGRPVYRVHDGRAVPGVPGPGGEHRRPGGHRRVRPLHRSGNSGGGRDQRRRGPGGGPPVRRPDRRRRRGFLRPRRGGAPGSAAGRRGRPGDHHRPAGRRRPGLYPVPQGGAHPQHPDLPAGGRRGLCGLRQLRHRHRSAVPPGPPGVRQPGELLDHRPAGQLRRLHRLRPGYAGRAGRPGLLPLLRGQRGQCIPQPHRYGVRHGQAGDRPHRRRQRQRLRAAGRRRAGYGPGPYRGRAHLRQGGGPGDAGRGDGPRLL